MSSRAKDITYAMPRADQEALADLPWEAGLEEWPAHGIQTINMRRGESRHLVFFVKAGGRQYAIKETSPEMASREIKQLQEVRRRGIYTLEPVGTVTAPGPMIAVGEVAGIVQYVPGDRGYCITRLAQRVIPQALLYRYPFTQPNRRMLWNAIVGLLVELHRSGIFWGDPSLANVLIDLSHHQVRAMLADAETVELFPSPLEERRRQQDLESLQESLLWTGEDIRQAQSADAAPGPITEEDIAYIRDHYAALWQAHGWTQLQQLGYAVRDFHWHIAPAADHAQSASPTAQAETVRPRWYQERIQEVLGITVPRQFARQFYGHLLTHKWLMSERAHTEVSLEEAAHNWYERYHLPAITLLRTYFPSEADSLEVYLGVLDRKWEMSVQAGYEVSLEEAALDYALSHTREAPVLHRAFNAVNALLPQRSELGQLLLADREE